MTIGRWRTLRANHLYEEVADEIKRYIEENGLQTGDLLPPERQLSEKLGVGRTSLREGLRKLETVGLIEIRPGQGAFVGDQNLSTIMDQLGRYFLTPSDHADIQDLVELREAIEVSAAGLAAIRRTQEHLNRLDELLESMRQKFTQGEYSHFAESSEFHRVILWASGNKVFRSFGNILDKLRIYQFELAVAIGTGNWLRENAARSLEEHADILNAIRSRDVEAACQATHRHIRRRDHQMLSRLSDNVTE